MAAAGQPLHLEKFGQALDHVAAAFERALLEALGRVAGDLEHAGEVESDQRTRQSAYAIAAMLRIEVRGRASTAATSLRERAQRCVASARSGDDEARALALVEEDELRAQLLAGEFAAAARRQCADDYELCAARVRALVQSRWENDELNPLGARTLASAGVAALSGISGLPDAEAALKRSVSARLPVAIAGVVDDLHRWLRAAGIEPAPADAAQVAPPAPAPARETGTERETTKERETATGESATAPAAAVVAPAVQRMSGAQAVNAAMPSVAVPAAELVAETARQLGTSPLAAPDQRLKPKSMPGLQPIAEIERDAIAFAHSIGVAPYSREARAGFFGNVRSRLRTAAVSPAQTAVIDVVAAMFDYVVDDRRLPEPAKPLLWRLQQPSIALSLLDPAYLGDEPRSLRRLIENMGAIANAFGDELSRDSELHRRLETVVRAVEIVAAALQTRSTVMARQVEHEYARAARNVAQLIDRVVQERSTLESTPDRRNRRNYRERPDRDREKVVTARLHDLLGERLHQHSVPESVREFVLNVWIRHLRSAALRDGEDSAEFKVAMQVVDDLLWSLDTLKERQSRRQLAQKIPPLISLLTQGLRAIGAREEEFKPFFDELFLIHLRKMQRRQRSGDATLDRTPTEGRITRPRTATGEVQTLTMRRAPPAPTSSGEHPGTADSAPPRAAQAKEGEVQPAGTAPPESAPAATGDTGTAVAAGTPDEGSERRLLEVLASLDLADLPLAPNPLELAPEEAMATLKRGDWVQLSARGEPLVLAKVAWINERRSVVLLVRHPDRRALSMRSADLLHNFQQGRAMRIR